MTRLQDPTQSKLPKSQLNVGYNIQFGQKDRPVEQTPPVQIDFVQDAFTGGAQQQPLTQPSETFQLSSFQFNQALLLQKLNQGNTSVQKAETKAQKETVFTEVYHTFIDEAINQVIQANLPHETRLFLADFAHEANGFASRALNFLVWDNIAETAKHPQLLLKAKSRLYKPQPLEGPANTLTLAETDALLSKTLNQVYQVILRYEPFIQENWIQGNNADGCQKAFELASTVMTEKATEKGLQLLLSSPHDLEKIFQQMKMPPYKFYTVLINLGLNAIKYTAASTPETGEGQITVKFSLRSSVKEGEQELLQIEVTDNGIGIPKKDQEKVVSGKRAQNAISEEIEGTGYGLQRVKKLSLNLEIESPVNPFSQSRPGTRITAQLPLDGIIEK